MASVYDQVYARSLSDPEGFWGAAAEDVHWDRRWDRVRDDSRPPFTRWFTGGRLNTCYNALDIHIDRGRGKQIALVYDSPVTGTVRMLTFFELRDAVARFAGALRRQGAEAGSEDRGERARREGAHLGVDRLERTALIGLDEATRLAIGRAELTELEHDHRPRRDRRDDQ